MSSFLKKLFSRDNTSIHINNPNNSSNPDSNYKETWLKSNKDNLKTLTNSLLQVKDEEFLFTELLLLKDHSPTILEDNKDFLLFSEILLQKKQFFKSESLKKLIFNIEIFKQIFEKIKIKQDEINNLIPQENISNLIINNKKIHPIEISIPKNFNFEISKFFFTQKNIFSILLRDNYEKIEDFLDYINFFFEKVLQESYIQENFCDFYSQIIKINLNLTEKILEIKSFLYEIFFDFFICTEKNYIEFSIYSFLNILSDKNEKDFILKKNIFFLMPNIYNMEILKKNNFISLKINLDFLFAYYTNNSNLKNPLNLFLKDSTELGEYDFEYDLVNIFLNFICSIEKSDYITYINSAFFEIYEISKNLFLDNFRIFQIKPPVVEEKLLCKNDIFQNNFLKNFIFMDFIINLYISFRKINNLHNNFKFHENQDKTSLLNQLNLQNFLMFELDYFLSDKILIENVFGEKSKNLSKKNNVLYDFFQDIMDLVYNKNFLCLYKKKYHENEKFSLNILDNTENKFDLSDYIFQNLSNNYIFTNKILDFPQILFIKLIKINSPTKILFDFLQIFKNFQEKKIIDQKPLNFLCLYIIQYTLQNFSDKTENYSIIIERLNLVNLFMPIDNLVENINLKITFLEILNKKNSLGSFTYKTTNQTSLYLLKDLIKDEGILKNFIFSCEKKNDKIFISENYLEKNLFENLKNYKNLFSIYEYISFISYKFTNSKGIKFYNNNFENFQRISFYIDFLNQNFFKNFEKKISLINFILFFIKSEKLHKFSLIFLHENDKILEILGITHIVSFIDLFAEYKLELNESENNQALSNLENLMNSIKIFEAENSPINSKNGEKLVHGFFSVLFQADKNKIKDLKNKIFQLIKFLNLKKVFTKNAINIDLKEFDYENFNINTILEIFIIKKFNIDLIHDIDDFYSKTTDIRESLGLTCDEFLLELSSIFIKYKLHNIYAGILNVFFKNNYRLFERCLLNLKKDKNFEFVNFIFEKKFELKILENSDNLNLITQINDWLSIKNKLDPVNCNTINNKQEKKSLILNRSNISEIKDFFQLLDYTRVDPLNPKDEHLLYCQDLNFKKNFKPEKEFIKKFEKENLTKKNFRNFMDILIVNLDTEKQQYSSDVQDKIDIGNTSYSLHPKLIELLDAINYNFRGKEFKLNTNLLMKSKLYSMLLSKNLCAVENILNWENFPADLKNIKKFGFLEKVFDEENKTLNEDNFLVVSGSDEKFFYLINLICLIYTEKDKDTKFTVILDRVVDILIEKMKKIEKNEEKNFDVKKNFIMFILDSIFFTLKNCKNFCFSNLLFWRFFVEKIENKILKENIFLEEKIFQEFKIDFLFYTKNNGESIFRENTDFMFESISRICPGFNILALFREEFFLKYDFKNKIQNLILKPELEEYKNKFNFFRKLFQEFTPKKCYIEIKQKNLDETQIYNMQEKNLFFDIFLILEIYKNINLKNVFTCIKIFDSEILKHFFNIPENSSIFSDERFSIEHILGIKLINSITNLSAFLYVEESLSYLVFNFYKNYLNTEEQFKDIIQELLYMPKFNNLVESSSNIIILEKNLNLIIKDYFETKIKIFQNFLNLFKEKFRINPISETAFKLLKIKSFICSSHNSNLRNVYNEIKDMDNYQDLESYIKDERIKIEIYKIYAS